MSVNENQELETVEEEVTEEVMEETAEEAAGEAAEKVTEEVTEEEPTKVKNKTPLGAVIAIAVLAVALVVVAFFAVRQFIKAPQTEETSQSAVEVTASHHTNAHGYPSWSVHFHTHEGDNNLHYSYLNENAEEISLTADEVNTKLNEQVASCGTMTLDNRMLQYYYNEGISTFYNEYYSYIAYMMDTAAPLDAQMDSTMGDGTGTWQQTFLESALNNFNTVAAMVQEAEKNGFTLSADDQQYLDSLLDLDTLCMYYGYPDAVTLLKDMIGPMATVESYQQYIKDTTMASYYTQSLAESIEVTDAEIEEYYNANQSVFTSQNIQKVDQNVTNVRHILIQPEAAEDGTISEEAWAAAEAEARRVLDEWKAGEATEATFGELAGTYSTDPGSSSMGGLYEEVYPGQMVTEFNDWCFDEARQTGDTDIVKTSYGYHIMYFVSQGDYIYWQRMCKESLLSEKVLDLRDSMLEGYETTVDTSKVILLDSSTATTPSAETTTEVTE